MLHDDRHRQRQYVIALPIPIAFPITVTVTVAVAIALPVSYAEPESVSDCQPEPLAGSAPSSRLQGPDPGGTANDRQRPDRA